MNYQPKISKQKVWKAIVAGASLCLILGLAIYAYASRYNRQATDIEVRLVKQDENVISKDRVMNILAKNGLSEIVNMPLNKIDIKKVEQAVLQDPWVKRATVFINNKNNIQIDIEQNKPVARLFFQSGKSAYLSQDRQLLPSDVSYAFYIPVFTNVPYLGSDEVSKKIKNVIATAGAYILADTFWNAQFTQLQLNDHFNILGSTVMGDQVVKLGDTSRFKEKLDNLFIFYKNGLSKIGFAQYQIVDASFKGQIVASPGIGYTTPVMSDTAVAIPDEDLVNIAHQNATINQTSLADTNQPAAPAKPTSAVVPAVKAPTKAPATNVNRANNATVNKPKTTTTKPVTQTSTKPKTSNTKTTTQPTTKPKPKPTTTTKPKPTTTTKPAVKKQN